jgi:hypothetical protein
MNDSEEAHGEDEFPGWDYADRVTLTVRSQSSMWEVKPSRPEAVWHVELPANTGGPAGPPVDTRRLAKAIARLPSELDGNSCCGGRQFALETKHHQVEIGPSGASTEFILEIASHVGDRALDLFLGAAGATVVAKIKRIMAGHSAGGREIPASDEEARERARMLLEKHYGVATLSDHEEVCDRENRRWDLPLRRQAKTYSALRSHLWVTMVYGLPRCGGRPRLKARHVGVR